MNPASTRKPKYDAPAVRTALRILEVLCQAGEPLGVSKVSRAIGENKSLTYRLLSTLRDEGWVAAEEPGPRYRVTLVPFQVVSQAVRGLDIRTAAAEPLRVLWDEIGESLYLAVLHADTALYVEHLDSRQDVRIAGMLGGRYPLHCAAPGKVLLAHAPADYFQRLAAEGFERRTANTLTSAETLAADLALVRSRGWATDNEEFGRGILCFAVPVHDHTGNVVAAVGTSVTTVAYTLETLIEQLGPKIIATGRAISQRLGFACGGETVNV
jgi:IclR family KDG regulon transcriptional repressor